MRYRHRIVRLEEYRRTRLPPSHFLAIVCTPWDLDPVDEDEWLQTLVCACGRVGCPELRIGALVPEKAPSAQAWSERVQEYYVQRRGGDA
jgi:hypothetical protein